MAGGGGEQSSSLWRCLLCKRIVPDDVAGLRVFSGISRFPHPFIPVLLHTHLTSPSSALKTLITHPANTPLPRFFYIPSRRFPPGWLRQFHSMLLEGSIHTTGAPQPPEHLAKAIRYVNAFITWDSK
ncbi:hypothetical protein PR048_029294 [Dryococelus australis]|uniref:Uncharacterized protein n=1 Tax=Dryococelus australis TaxID=614101 RepID=A0ABQ9GDC3_9NEOP|nr:hypothetical protein PR048_029294 [Dryococelus australis]